MKEWIEQEFATLQLGDKRLPKRMMLILERLAESPGAGLKAACTGWAEVNAAYRFFDNDQVDRQAILAPHRASTLARVKQHPRVVLVQDTTELDYTAHKSLAGAGPLSCLERRGFFAHNQLVVTPERLAVGLWNTAISARQAEKHGQSVDRKKKSIEEKETFRWLAGYRDACGLAAQAPGVQVISCADREADIYEIFAEWHIRCEQGQVCADWLIRSDDDRRLAAPGNGAAETGVAGPAKIRAAVAATPVLGTITFRVKEKVWLKKGPGGGRQKTRRAAREVTQEIRAAWLTIAPPYRKGRRLPAVTMSVVMAREIDPPAGEDPIEWVLLTSLSAVDFEQAKEIVELYLCRWEIEVFHRVLKTGCRVEKLQLKEADRIILAVVLYMIVAWRVLYVLTLGRECPDLPCDAIFDDDEWQSLWAIAHRGKKIERKPALGEFVKTMARFGGFLGRKGDGNPGPEAIWVGLSRLRDFTLAWQALMSRTRSPGPDCSRGS